MHKRIVIVSVLVALSLTGCIKKESSTKDVRPIAVRTVRVAVQSESASRVYVGEVESGSKMPLYHPMGGKLTALHVRNGQHVKQGDAIADLDDTQTRSLHDAAAATLRQAEDAYQRLEQVHDSGGLSDVKWIEMQTNLEKARQQEIATRKSLEDCHLTAPLEGVVADADVRVGQQLFPGQTVCNIVSLNTLQAVFMVPETDIAAFSVGDAVTVRVNALDDMPLQAVITEKSISAGAIAHTYQLKAVLRAPSKEVLPGMMVKVHTTRTEDAGIVVPSACVQTTPQGPAVWIVEGDTVSRRLIRASQFVKNGVLVTEGLKDGDRIVTAGYQKLYNGARVEE